MNRMRWLFLLLLLAALPFSLALVQRNAENRGRAVDTGVPEPFYLKGDYSIGFQKLELPYPYVWYWGWDGCNCNPKDVACTRSYDAGKSCSEGTTGDFPYGPFGGYRFHWGFRSPEDIYWALEMAKTLNMGIGNYTKPLWISGPILTDSGGGIYVDQSQASKLYCGVIDGKEVYKWVANYGQLTQTYVKWLQELAGRVKNHPNLAAITITHGMDGESSCKDDRCKTTYADGTQVPDPCAGFEGYKTTITAEYYKDFCNGTYDKDTGFCSGTMKPVFLQTSSWGDAGGQLGQYMPPMGMKFSGFTADTPGIIYGERWRGYGLIETFARYHNLIPTAVEPKYGNWFLDGGGEAGGQGTYWWNLEALWLRPLFIDMNPGYGLRWQIWEDPDYFSLINDHLNVTARTTPDVWIALRDTPNVCGAKTFAEFADNPCTKTYSGTSGKIGDYDFFLKRPDGLSGNKTIILTRPKAYGNDLTIEPLRLYNQEIPAAVQTYKYSRHIRRTDKATGNFYMSFDVDNDYPWANKPNQNFEATVYYLDLGTGPFYVEYKNSSGALVKKEVPRNNTQIWQKAVVTLDDAYLNDNLEGFTDFRINNGGPSSPDVYLHMIKIKGKGTAPADLKRRSNIICNLPNESIILGESPVLEANLIDGSGNPLSGKNIRITIDPYWYSYRISYGQTDSSGTAKKNLDLTGLPTLFQESRGTNEVEVVFPGDADYFSSSSICYFPLNSQRNDVQKRKVTASLSKNVVSVGDQVTVTVNLAGGNDFSVEGEGFGLPACYGSADGGGTGSCTFKIGGMALPGRRNIGVITGWNQSGGKMAASVNLPITVLGGVVEPTPPPTSPTPTPTPGRVISFFVKLKGVDALPSAGTAKNLNFKVKFVNKATNQVVIPAKAGFIIMPDSGARYWIVAVWGGDLPVAGNYDVYIKGPKHIQKKFGDITLKATTTTIDLTGQGDLPPGDLPNTSGIQDGVVNSLDAVYLTGCFASPQETSCLSRADLDFDGTITARDMELMNSTMVSQKWEDE